MAGWITRIDDGAQVELECVIGVPRAEVWDALTNPARVGNWWPAVSASGFAEREEGSELSFRSADGVELALALSHAPGGTLLGLRQSPASDRMAGGNLRSGADFGAGWHAIVDSPVGYLGDIPLPDGDAMLQAAYVVDAVQVAVWDQL